LTKHFATKRCLYENERFLQRIVIGIIMKSAAKADLISGGLQNDEK